MTPSLWRNTSWSLQFLDEWISARGGPNFDEGPLHITIIRNLKPGKTALTALEKSYRSDAYLEFVKKFTRYRNHRYSFGPHIKIKPPLQGWFRPMEESLFQEYPGDLWRRYIGNEFFVHTKNPGLYLKPEAAMCQRPTVVNPEWLPSNETESLSRIQTSKPPAWAYTPWFHDWVRNCSTVCPEAYDDSPWLPPSYTSVL